jgi:hypothetical protein
LKEICFPQIRNVIPAAEIYGIFLTAADSGDMITPIMFLHAGCFSVHVFFACPQALCSFRDFTGMSVVKNKKLREQQIPTAFCHQERILNPASSD